MQGDLVMRIASGNGLREFEMPNVGKQEGRFRCSSYKYITKR